MTHLPDSRRTVEPTALTPARIRVGIAAGSSPLSMACAMAFGLAGGVTVPTTGHAFECTNAGAFATAPDDTGDSRATACGHSAIASGNDATAIGAFTEATGQNDLAIGLSAKASGGDGIAIGDYTVTNNNRGVTMGSRSQSTAARATALGAFARAAAVDAVAIGGGDATNVGALATGTQSIAIGGGNSAVGEGGAFASGDDATAIGNEAVAAATAAVALGPGAVASGDNAVALGVSTEATLLHAIAIGTDANAKDVQTIAIGRSSDAGANSAVALGRFARSQGAGGIAIGRSSAVTTDHIGGIAIGSDGDDDGDAGNTEGAKADGLGAIAIGEDALAGNDRTIAIGQLASTGTGVNGISIGFKAEVGGNNSTAVGGLDTLALGNSSTAIGSGASSSGNFSTALGRLASAGDSFAFAAGLRADASGIRSMAMGVDAVASGTNAMSIGRGASATQLNAIAIGKDAVSDVADRIVFGNGAATYQLTGLAGAGTRPLLVDSTGVVVVGAAEPMAAATADGAGVLSANSTSLSNTVQARTLLSDSAVSLTPNRSDNRAGRLLPVNLTVVTLERAGIDPAVAQAVVEAHDAVTAELVALRFSARRDGWLRSDRYDHARADLEAQFRARLGETDYASYRTALEQTDRVVIAKVLPGLAASRSGLQPGDTLLRYNGSRQFSLAQLDHAMAAGAVVDSVSVTVLRSGLEMNLRMDSGALGALLYDDYTFLPRGLCDGCGEYL